MKNIFILLLIVVCAEGLYAQAPESFSYKASIMDETGQPIINQTVSFRFSIIKGGIIGEVVYAERHVVITNLYGLVSLAVGNGTILSGSFETIDWGADSYFLKVELDTAGGIFYTDMGTTQLLSVPYALYAKASEDSFSGDYNDLANKPITDGSETKINAGVNIIVSGMGTISEPYIINSETKIIAGSNIIVTGSGTDADPYIINERIHQIGESYGGGIIFYVYDNGRHGLIAATTDQDPGIEWYNGAVGYTNTTGDGVRGGIMNTALIITILTHNNPMGNFAAKVCADFSVTDGGVTYGDWYLPSKDELNLLYLQKSVVGGFANDYYWSSTEFSSISAWAQNFLNGVQYNLNKSYPYSVRAIRAF